MRRWLALSMQGMSEYEFLITADILTDDIKVLLYSTRGGNSSIHLLYKLISRNDKPSPN